MAKYVVMCGKYKGRGIVASFTKKSSAKKSASVREGKGQGRCAVYIKGRAGAYKRVS